MRFFATEFAQGRIDAFGDAVAGLSGLVALSAYQDRSAAFARGRRDLERYIAALEAGARCAFDTLVKQAREHAATYARYPEWEHHRRDAREAAARARMIVAAFKEAA